MTWVIVRDRGSFDTQTHRKQKKKKKSNVKRDMVSGVLRPEAKECPTATEC